MKRPTVGDFQAAFEKAIAAGTEAASAEVAKRRQETNTNGPFDSCGTAYIVLKIRRNSLIAKLIDANPKPLPRVSIDYSGSDGGYVLSLKRMTERQEQYINRLAEEAALQVLQAELGVSGHVRSFLD
jgi:hypothetical protein